LNTDTDNRSRRSSADTVADMFARDNFFSTAADLSARTRRSAYRYPLA
jgi:hypothetical protein